MRMNAFTRLIMGLLVVGLLGGLTMYILNLMAASAPAPTPAPSATLTQRQIFPPQPRLPALMFWLVSDDQKTLFGVWQATYTSGLADDSLKMLWRGVPAHYRLDNGQTLAEAFRNSPAAYPTARYDYFKNVVYGIIPPKPEKVFHVLLTPQDIAIWAGRLGGLNLREGLTLSAENFPAFYNAVLSNTPDTHMEFQRALAFATCEAVRRQPLHVLENDFEAWLSAEGITLNDSTPFEEWASLALRPTIALTNLECEVNALPVDTP